MKVSRVADLPPPTNVVDTREISALDLTLFIDALDDSATGELVVRDEHGCVQGVVFVEQRRVCWAAAPGLARRLRDLLTEPGQRHQPLGPGELDAVFDRCRKERVPFGEALVASRLITAERLHAALKQHATESILAMLSKGRLMGWRPRGAGGFQPRFTFSTGDLLIELVRSERESDAADADALWGRLASDADTGLVMLRAEGVGAPLPICGWAGSSASQLVELGRSVAATVDLACAIDPALHTVAAQTNRDGMAIVSEGRLVAIIVSGARRWARILARPR